MVEGRVLPVAVTLSAGQASDKAAVADLLALIEARAGRGHIPTQRDRKVQRQVDPALSRRRNRVECFFRKLKQFRQIATRSEKTAANHLAAVLLTCARLWTRA